jgi:hypothetical protein
MMGGIYDEPEGSSRIKGGMEWWGGEKSAFGWGGAEATWQQPDTATVAQP